MVTQEMKRNFILDRLKQLNVTHSQDGIPIHELSYEELKYELVLAEFRQMDIEVSEK